MQASVVFVRLMRFVSETQPGLFAAEDLGLNAGLHFESRLYHATFGLADHREGFDAFLQKRGPQWTHK